MFKRTAKLNFPLLIVLSIIFLNVNGIQELLNDYYEPTAITDKNGNGIIEWSDVNSVANTGEDYQLLAGIPKSEVKNYFTAADIKEGYALGKVSLDMVASLYGNDPTYWADLKDIAVQSSKYEHYYKSYQGKSPSDSTTTASITEENTTEESSTASENVKDNDTSATDEAVSEANTEVVEEESITGLFVVIIDTVVLDSVNGEKIGTLDKGTEIDVLGSGYGYYQITFEEQDGYVLIDDENVIPKEDYDNAWEETDRVEPTCTEDGYYTLTNSYSLIEQTTPLDATGHDDGEWTTVTKRGLYTKGLEQRLCTKDGAVLEEREINPIITLPVGIGIIAGICIIGGGVFFGVKKFRK